MDLKKLREKKCRKTGIQCSKYSISRQEGMHCARTNIDWVLLPSLMGNDALDSRKSINVLIIVCVMLRFLQNEIDEWANMILKDKRIEKANSY